MFFHLGNQSSEKPAASARPLRQEIPAQPFRRVVPEEEIDQFIRGFDGPARRQTRRGERAGASSRGARYEMKPQGINGRDFTLVQQMLTIVEPKRAGTGEQKAREILRLMNGMSIEQKRAHLRVLDGRVRAKGWAPDLAQLAFDAIDTAIFMLADDCE